MVFGQVSAWVDGFLVSDRNLLSLCWWISLFVDLFPLC